MRTFESWVQMFTMFTILLCSFLQNEEWRAAKDNFLEYLCSVLKEDSPSLSSSTKGIPFSRPELAYNPSHWYSEAHLQAEECIFLDRWSHKKMMAIEIYWQRSALCGITAIDKVDFQAALGQTFRFEPSAAVCACSQDSIITLVAPLQSRLPLLLKMWSARWSAKEKHYRQSTTL